LCDGAARLRTPGPRPIRRVGAGPGPISYRRPGRAARCSLWVKPSSVQRFEVHATKEGGHGCSSHPADPLRRRSLGGLSRASWLPEAARGGARRSQRCRTGSSDCATFVRERDVPQDRGDSRDATRDASRGSGQANARRGGGRGDPRRQQRLRSSQCPPRRWTRA
jgi:hypothetical protein